KKIYSIRQDEIVEKIDDFVDAIRELLGSGAYPVEHQILKVLYVSHSINYEPEIETVETKLAFVSQINFFSRKDTQKSNNAKFLRYTIPNIEYYVHVCSSA
ncbi:MAG: hypothetical protein D4S01_09125, partial [Dehalococcoidia bacterium]